MSDQLFNLTSLPLPGFEKRHPEKRDLLSGNVALFMETPHDAAALLPDFNRRVHGIIFTPGPLFTHTEITPHLWHLCIPDSMHSMLQGIAKSLLGMLGHAQKTEEENERLRIDLERTKRVQEQIRRDYDTNIEKLIESVDILRNEMEKTKQAQQQLQEKETLLRTLLETLPDLVWLKDPNGVYLSCNHRFENLFGTRRDDIIGKTDYDFVDQELASFFTRNDQAAIQARKPRKNEELVTFASDGHQELLETIKAPMYGPDRELIGVLGVGRDITEHKRTEEELLNVNTYIQNIIDSMPSVLIGINSNGKVTHWNKGAEQATGLTAPQAFNQLLVELLPHLEEKEPQINHAIQTGEIFFEAGTPHDKNGRVFYEDITIYPLSSETTPGAVIRIDDVTRHCELESQLNQSRKMDAIGQLAGGIAHDFNNMLTGITGAAELLALTNKELEEDGNGLIDLILTSTSRAADLTAKLLAFSRKGNQESRPVDMHSVIDDALGILRSTIDKKITLVTVTKAEASLVTGDHSGLQSALLNMGINASHAMPHGGELSISTRNLTLDADYCAVSAFDIEPGNYIEVEVRDNGCGIPPENLPRIFEPFFTTRKAGAGSGLGLAAVYGTIKNHQGAMHVYSEEGTGTVFHLYLPSSEQTERVSAPTESPVVSGTGTILLVDDEESILSIGKRILERMGYHVLSATNGQQAVELFRDHHPEIDLVITDMIMPIMNGREAFWEMKKIDARCKVIVASGFTQDENLDELYQAGLAGFIQKPYRNFELSQLVAEKLNAAG